MKRTFLYSGFTLVEVMVSILIGAFIITGVYTLLGTSADNYSKIASSVEEIGNVQSGIQILQRDIDSMIHSLPVSLSEGSINTSWDLVNGVYQELSSDIESAGLYPSESEIGFPNDRLGFFISLPDDLAVRYGKDIAHVLYFTALTQNKFSEDLQIPGRLNTYGISRKLYRLFTPPDRVYERLKRLNPEFSDYKAAASIPRGINLATGSSDDVGWYEEEPSSAVFSLVAGWVSQFDVKVGYVLEGKRTSEVFESFSDNVDSLSDLSLSQLIGVRSLHEVLQADALLGSERVVPVKLSFVFRVCPPEFIGRLKGSDWNVALGPDAQYLGKKRILPTVTKYTRSLVR